MSLLAATGTFRPTCPGCGHRSAPSAEWCSRCGKFLLIMPRAEWEAELKRLRLREKWVA